MSRAMPPPKLAAQEHQQKTPLHNRPLAIAQNYFLWNTGGWRIQSDAATLLAAGRAAQGDQRADAGRAAAAAAAAAVGRLRLGG